MIVNDDDNADKDYDVGGIDKMMVMIYI